MSFSWAVTDQTRREPKKPETFRGYFTDIQRAARRSLPKKPDKDLRELLGLTLVPAGNETDRANTINTQLHAVPTDLKAVDIPEKGAKDETSEIQKPKKSFAEKIISSLPCTTKKTDECTEREKIISSFAVYFAIVIIILLIIVTILAATISALNRNDEDNSSSVNLLHTNNSSTPYPQSEQTSTTVRQQSITSTPMSSIKTQFPSSSRTTASAISNVTVTPFATTTETNTPTPSSVTKTQSVSKITTQSQSTPVPTSRGTTVPSGPQTTSISVTPIRNNTSTLSTPSSTTITVSSVTRSTTTTSTRSAITDSKTSAPDTTRTPSTTSTNTPRTTTTEAIRTSSTSSTSSTTSQTTTTTTTTTSSSTTATPTTTNPPLPTLERPRITCTTSTCLAARTTLDRLNYNTSPCSDFYEFSCGGWVNKTLRQQTDSSQRNVPSSVREEQRMKLLKQLQVLLQAVYFDTDSFTVRVSRRLYQSCLESNINGDTELGEHHLTSTRELREVLSSLGMSEQGDIPLDLDILIETARTVFEVTPFFKTDVKPLGSGNNAKVFGIEISPPDMYLASEDYMVPFENNQVPLYVSKVSEILYNYLTSFNSDGIPGVPGTRRRRSARTRRQNNDQVSYEEVYFKVLRSFDVDLNISQIIDETNTFSSEKTSIITYDTLKELYPNINWDAALGIRSGNALIQIVNRQYFQALNDLYPLYNTDDVKLYVFLSVLVQRVWRYMPYPSRNLLTDVGKRSDAIYTEVDCVETTLRLAHEETHAMYVGQFTQDTLRNRLNIANLENVVSNAFQSLLSQSGWVMQDLQRVVSAVLTNTKLAFSPVRAYVRETEGITGAQQSFLTLALELHQQKQGYKRFLVTTAVNEDNLIQDWTSTHLDYEPSLHLIAVPTGISVFLSDENQPNFDFHGYVGYMLAEEIIKILTGEMEDGFLPDWWGVENQNRFLPIKQCFTSQLQAVRKRTRSACTVTQSGLTHPALLGVSTGEMEDGFLPDWWGVENQNRFQPIKQCFTAQLQVNQPVDVGKVIVSNGAFQIIDQVFKTTTPSRSDFILDSPFTGDMLFFINTAQLECSADAEGFLKIRVNNRMSNSERFAQIFSCPESSPMVKEERCLVLN